MKVTKQNCQIEVEPLKAPFGFKGGYVSGIWQSAALMQDAAGNYGVGLGLQSPLWSDAAVFADHSEAGGNCLMYLMTEFAMKTAAALKWDTPLELLDQLIEPTYGYGQHITGRKDLRLTYALNALVPVDNAAWLLYSRAKGISDFDAMVPKDFQPALSARHEKLACIPLITYGVDLAGIQGLLDQGYFFMKIKIGSDPDKDGDLDKMLDWDCKRLSEIHDAVKDCRTEHTDSGYIPYYLDANGRYDTKERLLKLLDHADKIGMLDRIMIVEEPFPEEYHADVRDVPARLAADESAHSDKDAVERIDMGYGAIALKPIAKTMSMSLRIAKIAHERNVPCFCADLTVNPVMVDWNKNVAARLATLPGMKVGLIESNGAQNYSNWDAMKGYHPSNGASWVDPVDGVFTLDESFYKHSGGIFGDSAHYDKLVGRK